MDRVNNEANNHISKLLPLVKPKLPLPYIKTYDGTLHQSTLYYITVNHNTLHNITVHQNTFSKLQYTISNHTTKSFVKKMLSFKWNLKIFRNSNFRSEKNSVVDLVIGLKATKCIILMAAYFNLAKIKTKYTSVFENVNIWYILFSP